MAYQAIANGARGLVFFGGHLTQVDVARGRGARLELDVLGAGAAAARRGARARRRVAAGARRAGREAAREGVDARTSSSSRARRRRSST